MATAQYITPAQDEGDSDGVVDQDYDSLMTSVTSGIRDYQYENGRRYHAYKEGKYILPNDEEEQDRLDTQYHAVRLAFDNKPFFAPIGDSPKAILDVGTGTGIWAIDVADQYPSATVIGTDLSPIQPRWVPPNVQFEIDDLESQWTYEPNKFDLIHTRILLGGSVLDWPAFFKQAFEHCKPGGFFECQELDVEVQSDDYDFPPDSHVKKWCRMQCEAALKAGRPLRIYPEDVKSQIEAAGFFDVTVRPFKVPIGAWPADKRLQEAGVIQLAAMIEGVFGLSVALWTRFLGWKAEDVHAELAKVKEEFKSKKAHAYWPIYSIYGKKPTEATAKA
ncbi:MAG: hypothetical protein M1833_005245 [Piccolia ochrophora]|nr:MAG: hypothetical protein M1833_005245 [Piccolia ochrophora]